MEIEKSRLKTFNKWCNPHVKAEDLARIGFIYLESDNNHDKVKCVFCGLVLHNWVAGDVPVQEHYKYSKNCSLLTGEATLNRPIDGKKLSNELSIIGNDVKLPKLFNDLNYSYNLKSVDLHKQTGFLNTDYSDSNYCYHSEYVDLQKRIDSFATWSISMEQKPQELAEAGFFYTGYSDKVICFYCNIGLKDWERDDIPIEEHIKHSSKCQFLYMVKGSQYIGEKLKKSTEIDLNSNNVTNFTCVCCLDKFPDILFKKCNHCVTCADCSIKVDNCPVCRQPISKRIKTYFK